MTPPVLPPQIRVIVRDWLNANQIVLRGRDGNVLVDTGYVTRAATTLALRAGLPERRACDLLVNTHCHSDHMGCNAAVQRSYGCPTLIPADEAPLIRDWDVRACGSTTPGSRPSASPSTGAHDGAVRTAGATGLAGDRGAGSRCRRAGVLE